MHVRWVYKCVSVDQQWAEDHFLAQGKYSNKKIKSWWNYGDTVLGAKIWTGLPTHHQIYSTFFYHNIYLKNKICLSLPNFSEKNEFQSLKYYPAGNTKNHFWSLKEHHRINGRARTKSQIFRSFSYFNLNYLIPESFMKFPFIQLFFCKSL